MESIIYFDSLEELPLYNWDRYLATSCNNWFLRTFDGRQRIIEDEKLIDLEKMLQDDYFNLLNDPAFIVRLQKWAKIEALRTKYVAFCSIIERLKIGFSPEQQHIRMKYIDTLEKSGFKMAKINTYEGDLEELAQIQLKVDSIKTQMQILVDEVKDESKGEKTKLEKQLLQTSMALKLGYHLDAKQITVSEWIYMQELVKEKYAKPEN